MPNYAVIVDNLVSNIIVADSKEIAEQVTGQLCIEYADEKPAYVGAKYNPETGEIEQLEQVYFMGEPVENN